MADNVPISSMHKWIIILVVTLTFHHDAALFEVSASGLHLTPLWDQSGNASQCDMQNRFNDEGVVIFQGNPHKTCSLQATTLSESAALIEIPKSANNLTHFFLYFAQEEEDCSNRYVLIHGQDLSCSVAVVHGRFTVNLRGDINLTINEVAATAGSVPSGLLTTEGSLPAGISATSGSLPLGCPEYTNDILYDNGTREEVTTICNTQGFTNVIACDYEGSSVGACRIPFPTDCSNTITQYQVTFECSENATKSQTLLILYADDITELDLSRNNIIDLGINSFHGLPLRVLYLYKNHLETLADGVFRGLRYLEQLWLLGNNLVMLEGGVFQGLHNLEILSLYENSMVDLDSGLFDGLTKLTRVDLDTCELRALPVGLFRDLENLNKLYLYGNRLFMLAVGVFDGLVSLIHLSLSNNQLTELQVGTFLGLGNLNALYLAGNRLSVLEVGLFQGLSSVMELSLSKNSLSILPPGLLQEMPLLSGLYLQVNALVTLDGNPFQNLSKLTYIDLSVNKLVSLPAGVFQGLYILSSLFLQDNQLTSIDGDLFSGLSTLKVIALQENNMTEVNDSMFRDLAQLESIGLGGNSFVRLNYTLFKGLSNLNNIFLNDNGLTELDVEIFKDTTMLAFIDLSTNKLETIPDIKHLAQLGFLNLRNNPLIGIDSSTFTSLPRHAQVFVSQHEICHCYIPEGVNCSAADDRSPYLTCDRLLSDRVLLVLMWIIGLNALGGNLFVLAWRRKTTQKSRVQAMFLSSLALSDLLMGVYMLIIGSVDLYYSQDFPLHSETWRSGITCRICGAIAIASCEASVFFVTLISIDRLISVRFPYSTKKIGKRSASAIVVVTWLISSVLGILPSILSGVNFKFYDNSHVCIGLPLALTEMYSTQGFYQKVEKDGYVYFTNTFITESKGFVSGMYYSVVVFLGLNCLCYLTIFGCYVEIVRAVYKSSKRAGINREMKNQIRMTAKVAAIVVTDFCCWFPIILLGILVQARIITLPPSVYAWSVTFVLPINSAINPYLYTIAAIIGSRQKHDEPSGNRSTESTQERNLTQTQNAPLRSVSTAETQRASNTDLLPNVPVHHGNDTDV